jgi:pimeloyl-ACP methyl ester carboxylesterase
MIQLELAMMALDAWREAGTFLDWRGLRVFHRVAGPRERPATATAEPMLLLHGFPTSSWDWAGVWDALAAHHRVIALDYVGFGFSDKPPAGPYSVFAYADQVEAVLAALGVARCHVLAHDLGDTVAQELLARDRDRGATTVASVAFLNGGVFPELHRPRLGQRLLASPLGAVAARLSGRRLFERGLAEVFGPRTKPSRDELDAFWRSAARAGGTRNYHRIIGYMAERRLYRERWVREVIEPRVPQCFIYGLRDPVSGAHVVARLHKLVRDVRVVELAEVGHYPQTEAAAEVVRAYQQFRAG